MNRVLGEATAVEQSTLKELIDHILAVHHMYLRRELPLIEQRINEVRELEADSLRGLAGVFAGLKAELEMHMRKEEMILFPHIVRAEQSVQAGRPWAPPPFGSFGNPIQVMEHEHDSAIHALDEMRRLTNGYRLPEDADDNRRVLYAGLEGLERDLRVHIHLENDILFPRSMAMEPVSSQES